MFENFCCVKILLHFFDFLRNLFSDALYSSNNADSLLPQRFIVIVVVVVEHVYPPVTKQRQMLTYWTIRTLFIAVTTSLLEESATA